MQAKFSDEVVGEVLINTLQKTPLLCPLADYIMVIKDNVQNARDEYQEKSLGQMLPVAAPMAEVSLCSQVIGWSFESGPKCTPAHPETHWLHQLAHHQRQIVD